MNPMFEFSMPMSENAFNAMRSAEMLAREQGGNHIDTEHLFIGILAQQNSIGAKIMTSFGVDFEKAKLAMAISATKKPAQPSQMVQLSENVGLTFRMSIELARDHHQDYCGTEHILYSLLSQSRSKAVELLKNLGVDAKLVLSALEKHLERENSEHTAAGTRVSRGGRGSFLNKFGTNLTARAMKGELDPVIGRDREVTRMVTILSRRTKNNPVLIGEPGVGKTAVVEGLAQRIASEDVPENLAGKAIYQLDLAGMVAGTKYRGEFEDRIKRVLGEVRADPNIIIFIDELHLLMGAGAADGAMDAANMLKPALARGEFRLIGATTLDEYRRHIEKDAALARRLQSIVVDEPSAKDTVKIIEGLAGNYETFHNVRLNQNVIREAVRLAERYITERFMPDKAIDVIDEAAALTRVRATKNQPSNELKTMRHELAMLNEKMEDAVAREDYEAAALYKMRIARSGEKIAELEKVTADGGRMTLKLDDVAQAVATMTGVPVAQLRRTEATRLSNLEKHLGKHIIGQDEAVAQVSRAIRRARSGINAGRRPIGSFVFLGPTGVGKTELARVVAREVFGSDKSLIKIDMSEFAEKHNTSRLVGAPAGYVGYDDGGHLTDRVRRQPYSVVLFDEIEKAHPEVFNMLLQLLEDGRLTDGKGREVDFSNTVVILTSNLGAEKYDDTTLGFQATNGQKTHADNQAAIIKELERVMRPELVNRFDKIVVFRGLNRADVGRIFDNLISELNERLAAKGLAVKVEPTAKRWLTERGYSTKFGARPLRRVIQDELEHALAEGILRGQFKRGDVVRVNSKKDQIVLSKVTE